MQLTPADVKHLYTSEDPVHDFSHIERVHRHALQIAEKEGAAIEIVAAAALLHDAEDATSATDARLTHHEASAAFAGRFLAARHWDADAVAAVQACIRAHRFRAGDVPQSLEAKCLFDADKLDAIGAIGAARAIAYATQAGTPWYATPSQLFLETNEKEAGEVHSAYHEFCFKLRNIRQRLQTPTGQLLAVKRHQALAQFFTQLQAEYTGVVVDEIQRTNTVLYCDNWQATVAFYKDVLQLRAETELEWFVEFALGNNAYVSLIDTARTKHKSSHGEGVLLAWQVADLASWHQKLTDLGVAVSAIKSELNAHLFRFRDPEGTRIELWE